MRWFLVFFVLQLAVSVMLIANSHPSTKRVLGVSYLAQEEDSPTPTSADESSVQQNDQPTTDQSENTQTQPPADKAAPPLETQQNAQENKPAEIPAEKQNASSDSHDAQPSNTENIDQKSESTQTFKSDLPEAVFTPEETLTSSEKVNQDSINEVEKENEQLKNTLVPEQQTTLLLRFATDKVDDIDKFLRTNDFASTNFATLRLTEHLLKTQAVLKQVSPSKRQGLNNQLKNFCAHADETLRSAEISVLEESEQDIEITRGICLNNQ